MGRVFYPDKLCLIKVLLQIRMKARSLQAP